MSSAMTSVEQASPSILCGTLTATGTDVDAYTDSVSSRFATKGIRAVKLIAPTLTASSHTNTSVVLYGDKATQNDYIATDGSRDAYVQVQQASLLGIRFGTIGDKLEYRIET